MKKIILIISISLIIVILVFAVVFGLNSKSVSKIVNDIDISIQLSLQVDNNEYSENFGKNYILQEITVKNNSDKDIVMQCNSNDNSKKFIGLNYLDNISNEAENEDYYSIVYAQDSNYIFDNKYYYETDKEKEDILNMLIREYKFKVDKYKYKSFIVGNQSAEDIMFTNNAKYIDIDKSQVNKL